MYSRIKNLGSSKNPEDVFILLFQVLFFVGATKYFWRIIPELSSKFFFGWENHGDKNIRNYKEYERPFTNPRGLSPRKSSSMISIPLIHLLNVYIFLPCSNGTNSLYLGL